MPSGTFAMIKKGNVVLYLDKELVEKSRELGFNLSRTFENHLKQLISQLSNNLHKMASFPKMRLCGGPDRIRTGDLLHVKQMS